jgi:hypothetical protein
MNFFKNVSRRQRIIQYVLFLSTTAVVVFGLAQSPQKDPDRLIVDGKLEPDRIPDWILWNRIFQMAVDMNETAPRGGQELWIDKLHLPEEVMGEIIALGYEQQKMSDDLVKEAQKHISDSKKNDSDLKDHPNKKEALKSRLIKTQLNMESGTLEMRDELRERIGEDAFLRLSSFARLQIAPKVKIGG